MAEEKKERISLRDTIDYSKMLTNVNIGSSYIFALEQFMLYHIMRLDDPGESKVMFKKFEDYVLGKIDLEKDPWTELEMHLFTIFSLQQMLKIKAIEMGFSTKNKATLDPDLVDELMKATFEGKTDKLNEINQKIEESIKEQSP